jgi:hypothetical protein
MDKTVAKLLECQSTQCQPLIELKPQDGDIVVVDSLISLDSETSTLWLQDYPPFLSRLEDARVRLVTEVTTASVIEQMRGFRAGWHPYCRVLGRYRSVSQPVPELELFMLSVKSPPQRLPCAVADLYNEGEHIRKDFFYHQEAVRQQLIESTKIQFLLMEAEKPGQTAREILAANRGDILAEDDYSVAWNLSQITAFEDEIHAGFWAFWLGLYYFLQNLPDAAPVIESLRFKFFHYSSFITSEEWEENLPSLDALGLLRFGVTATSRLFGALIGLPVVGVPSDTVIKSTR